jgi:hypothetical protein
VSPLDSLTKGRASLDPLLNSAGFSWVAGAVGQGSGGPFASGKYVRGDRELELHFRYGLGLVSYRIGKETVSHEDYIRFLGHARDATYPGFPADPLDAFPALASDISRWCSDFLSGEGASIAGAHRAAVERSKLSGLAKMELP